MGGRQGWDTSHTRAGWLARDGSHTHSTWLGVQACAAVAVAAAPAATSATAASGRWPPVRAARRRFQWLFVRVEVELRKIQAHRPELGTLVPAAPREAHVHGHSGEGGHAPDSGSEEEGEARRGASSGNTPTKERRKDRRGGSGPGRVVQLPVLDMNPRR